MIILPLLIFGLIFYKNRIYRKVVFVYLLVATIFLVTAFVLVSLFYLKISTSLFIIPFVSLVIGETVSYFLQGKKELRGAIDEATLLRNLLSSKENELSKLQKVLNESGEESLQLVNKIDSSKRTLIG